MPLPSAARAIIGHPVPFRLDLSALGAVTPTQLNALCHVARSSSHAVHFDNPRPRSTLEVVESGSHYLVTDGDSVAEELPWLYRLYTHYIPDLVHRSAGVELQPSRFRRSAITLNLIRGTGSRYERHVDSNSVTGLLFASTLSPSEGGALRMQYPDRATLDITPTAGELLVFDARWVPHEVTPLRTDIERISVPMNYFLPTDIETRPEFLDAYIFGDHG